MKEHSGKSSSSRQPDEHLGDYPLAPHRFDGLNEIFKEFSSSAFKKLSDAEKGEKIHRTLLTLIQKTPMPCFLLPAILEYLDKVHELQAFDSLSFLHFELWLNQFSGMSAEDNAQVRGKITGKWVPREEYQILFPIGMGKTYPGSHYVTAHGSPDLDTTIASFWGWVDAFSARVGQGLHLWNVPGGPSDDQEEVQVLFQQIFGKGVFHHLAKTRTTLGLSGIDLMTQKGVVRKGMEESIQDLDPERAQQSIVLVDKQGYYIGDWRSVDAEGVRQVIDLLNNCMRWFQSHLQIHLVSLFAQPSLSVKDLPAFIKTVFLTTIGESEPAKEFTGKQRMLLDHYLSRVLNISKGIQSTFEELAKGFTALKLFEFQEFVEHIESLHQSAIFNRSGQLIEDRPQLFHALEKIIVGLQKAIRSVRLYVNRLDVALNIKQSVFEHHPHPISYRAEVEEIRSKMGNYHSLTVTATDAEGKQIPLGVVQAADLYKATLGTVSLRDFCNREETKIPSYLEVISVIDHHKSNLNTSSATMILISDSQSSNVLCAELAFQINDRFSTGGMTVQQIGEQLKGIQHLSSSADKRLYRRLLQRLLVAEHSTGSFVDPLREYVEYLHFLYAILDDTDLLSKVTTRDVECVVDLLNRMKSLTVKKEVEILSLRDLPRDSSFARKAADRILQHPEMYSLYRKVYLAREESVDSNLVLCAQGQPSSIFNDTKEQNGCARVGQTKLFAKNFPSFATHQDNIRKQWVTSALKFWQDHPEVDLHLHMVSTVSSAENLFAGTEIVYQHQDELWIWIPFTEGSIEHLKSFLNAFRTAPPIASHREFAVEFYGNHAKQYSRIFEESFLPIADKKLMEKDALSLAVLKFKAGFINSRKAMISPYLPKLVT